MSAVTELELAHIRIILQTLRTRAKLLADWQESTERSVRNIRSGVYPSSSPAARIRREVYLQNQIDERQYKIDLLKQAIEYFDGEEEQQPSEAPAQS